MCEKLIKGPDPVQVLHSLNIFHIIFKCFYCRVWTSKCRLGNDTGWLFRVRINVSWFGKYDAFFIFHDTGFPTYPENHDTKEGFCFPNRETKSKFFPTVKVKNDFSRCVSHFLLFLSWHKILFSSINWSQFL